MTRIINLFIRVIRVIRGDKFLLLTQHSLDFRFQIR